MLTARGWHLVTALALLVLVSACDGDDAAADPVEVDRNALEHLVIDANLNRRLRGESSFAGSWLDPVAPGDYVAFTAGVDQWSDALQRDHPELADALVVVEARFSLAALDAAAARLRAARQGDDGELEALHDTDWDAIVAVPENRVVVRSLDENVIDAVQAAFSNRIVVVEAAATTTTVND